MSVAGMTPEAFRIRIAGAGLQEIGLWLHENAPSVRYKTGRTHHTRWCRVRVIRLSQNRNYAGTDIDEATLALASRLAKVRLALGTALPEGSALPALWCHPLPMRPLVSMAFGAAWTPLLRL